VAPLQQGDKPLSPSEVAMQCEKTFSQQRPGVILFSSQNFATIEGEASMENMAYFHELITVLLEADMQFTTFEKAEHF
jgi:hypothetical protein